MTMRLQTWPLWIICAVTCCGPAYSAEAPTDRLLQLGLLEVIGGRI